MENNILDEIRILKNENKISKARARIADYIIENPEKVAGMKKTTLARNSGVGYSVLKGFFLSDLNMEYKIFNKKITKLAEKMKGDIYYTHILHKIFHKIKNESLSFTEKEIAEGIIRNYKRIPKITFYKFSCNLGISKKSIIKFLKTYLEYEKYEDLQNRINRELAMRGMLN
jgi:DNA-binding MurR/RpiR family transcriptional regulator